MTNEKQKKIDVDWQKSDEIQPMISMESRTVNKTPLVPLEKEEINTLIHILAVAGNGKFSGLIKKLRGAADNADSLKH